MIDGIAAGQWLLNYGTVRPGMCLYYVWQAYKAQGASTGLGAPNAYIAWGDSDGQRPGDRNPPAGAAVWWGRRYRDGNVDGDVVISLGDGRVAVTEAPGQGSVTGSCTLDERENQIGREYLGWTSSIFDCPINVAAGKDAAPAPEQPTITTPTLEELMSMKSVVIGQGNTSGGVDATILDFSTGFKSDFTSDLSYAQSIGNIFTTGGFVLVTPSHYVKLLKDFTAFYPVTLAPKA